MKEKKKLKPRYTHCLNLSEEQEIKFRQAKEKSKFSLPTIVMAMCDAINNS